MNSRYLLATILLSLSHLAWAQPDVNHCDYGAAHKDAPAEMAQFEFLIGHFDITLHARQGNDWSPPRPTNAQWHGYYGLAGLAIIDEWYDPLPDIQPDGARGINVRMYDEEEGVWDMMWIATGGRQVQELKAEVQDGVLTMWQVHPARDGFKAEFRVTGDTSWNRIEYRQDADSGEWQPQFMLKATQVDCPPKG